MEPYWSKVLNQRVSRRRGLAAISASGAAAAFLAACGGSSDGAPSQPVSQLLAQPIDTTKDAKRGGVLFVRRQSDIQSLDPHFLNSSSATGVYQRMIRLKETHLEPAKLDFVGDTVESWEYSGDRLQLTFKIRPFKTHDIPPVNGRPVDAEDIAFSWKRFSTIGTVRANFANSVNPEAPITSVTAVDSKTVVMKLAQPVSGLIALLATASGSWLLMPKEAESGFDPVKKPIGWGPFLAADYTPSVSLTFKRHPGYYEADRIYVDEIQDFIIPEYAAGLAQFRAGRIYKYDLRQEDILQTKKDVPELQMYIDTPPTQHGIAMFSWNPSLATPFRDKRLRQALAMSLDSSVLLDVFHNVEAFRSQGIPVEPFRYTCVPAWCNLIFSGDYWLNPDDAKKFGPNVKYYQHNPEEAKKLVSAAGYPNGVDSVANWATGYGGDVYPRYAESAAAYAAEVGIRLRANTSPITGDFRAKYADNPGEFDGVTYRLRVSGGIFDPIERAFLEFTPAGGVSYTGFYSDDSSYKKGDPKYTDFLKKARQEFDNERRTTLSQEFQRMEAENQYQPSFPGTASVLKLVWPTLRNESVFYASSGPYVGQWLDPTQPPHNKS